MEYLKADKRREQILQAACDLAEKTHYRDIRRHHLVKRCNTAAGNISRVMGSMDELRGQLVDYALVHERSVIIAQAIIDRHPAVSHLDAKQRAKILSVAY